jgi:hypothetical protein
VAFQQALGKADRGENRDQQQKTGQDSAGSFFHNSSIGDHEILMLLLYRDSEKKQEYPKKSGKILGNLAVDVLNRKGLCAILLNTIKIGSS